MELEHYVFFGSASQVQARLTALLNFPPEVFHELLEHVRDAALSEAQCEAHLALLLDEAHSSTWFSIEGVSEVGETSKGSRAGDPWAILPITF